MGMEKRQKTGNAEKSTGTAGSKVQNYKCGTKTRCSQMTSCEEAMYYLKECGLTTLDGGGDGMPCEILCRKV